ncbi:hypothetical protein [Litorivivens sp.]|uniref:hypothetical protein n=1 Tax=Litorivivens sp. TaxID=2020868 RepID=UPI0035664DFE
MEPYSALFLTIGAALLLLSWVQLLITSSNEDYTWALCTLILPPVSYLYGLFRLDKAMDAIATAALGWVLILLACAT